MTRLQSALVLYGFGVLGMFLVVAPWTPVWDHVTLALMPTAAGAWIRSGWVRGAISGLGVLDMIAAFGEAAGFWRSERDAAAGRDS